MCRFHHPVYAPEHAGAAEVGGHTANGLTLEHSLSGYLRRELGAGQVFGMEVEDHDEDRSFEEPVFLGYRDGHGELAGFAYSALPPFGLRPPRGRPLGQSLRSSDSWVRLSTPRNQATSSTREA
jgi:hypothetical protein